MHFLPPGLNNSHFDRRAIWVSPFLLLFSPLGRCILVYMECCLSVLFFVIGWQSAPAPVLTKPYPTAYFSPDSESIFLATPHFKHSNSFTLMVYHRSSAPFSLISALLLQPYFLLPYSVSCQVMSGHPRLTGNLLL